MKRSAFRSGSGPKLAQLDELDDLLTVFRGFFMLFNDIVEFIKNLAALLGLRSE